MTVLFRGSFFAVLLALAGCASPPTPSGYSPTSTERQLVVLIEKRLTYAYDVAWFKYQRNLAIQDPQREAALLQKVTAQGQALGLASSTVAAFFNSQMTASREFQEEAIAGWRGGTALPRDSQVDLAKDIRPRVDAINQEMLVLLASSEMRWSPALAEYAYQFMRSREYSPNVANAATATLAR